MAACIHAAPREEDADWIHRVLHDAPSCRSANGDLLRLAKPPSSRYSFTSVQRTGKHVGALRGRRRGAIGEAAAGVVVGGGVLALAGSSDVVLLLYTALRLKELVALDVDDMSISARKGLLVVRSGKGDVYREVPLSRSCRNALERLLADRVARVADGERALLLGPRGSRLTARSVDRAVRGVAARAGLELSAHVPRHTCVTNLVRGGNDLVLIAELAGYRRLETTRRYSLPSAADRQAAMDALELEE